MKVVADISLRNFKFWSGAVDTANAMTCDQLDTFEEFLEATYPDGMTDTQINDLFWFERDFVFDNCGMFPKFYKVTAQCGLAKYIKAGDSKDLNKLEESTIANELVDEDDCDEVEDISDVDLDEFETIHFFNVWSRIKHKQKTFFCYNDCVEDLKGAFELCKVEEIASVSPVGIEGAEDWEDWDGVDQMIEEFVYDEDEIWNKYNIPVYAIPRICKLVLDPNDEKDCYDIPDTFALNQYNRDLELNDEDIKNIDEFVNGLNEAMPNGYTIDWDEESCGSPFFDSRPEFGLAMDCVILRVYPKDEQE